MNYSIVINTSRQNVERHLSALALAKIICANPQNTLSLFFWQDGTDTALAYCQPPRNEISIQQRWISFAADHQIPLQVCIASSLRRGVLDNAEAKRHDAPMATAHPSFEIAGLGALIEARCSADRNLQF